ncbi:MAG: hypothetical protein U5Q44_14190 [Dehalococcoidia bacterium]|nr:hypothetical protein [Dehalococcoidia bacterium]
MKKLFHSVFRIARRFARHAVEGVGGLVALACHAASLEVSVSVWCWNLRRGHTFERGMQYLLVMLEGIHPRGKHELAGRGQAIHASRRAAFGGVPEGGNEPGTLKLAQGAIDRSAIAMGHAALGEALRQLVAIGIPVLEERQEAGGEELSVQSRPGAAWRGVLLVGGHETSIGSCVQYAHTVRMPQWADR